MNQAVQSTVFVDGNNVMGSRPDGWWRNRAKAARRLVAEITPLALRHGGVWTIVFDGRAPPGTEAAPACLTLVHTGHGRRDSADDRIVELIHALPDRASSLVYTSDAKLRDRVRALGAQVAGARALLNEIEAVRGALEQSPAGRSFDLADARDELGRHDMTFEGDIASLNEHFFFKEFTYSTNTFRPGPSTELELADR